MKAKADKIIAKDTYKETIRKGLENEHMHRWSKLVLLDLVLLAVKCNIQYVGVISTAAGLLSRNKTVWLYSRAQWNLNMAHFQMFPWKIWILFFFKTVFQISSKAKKICHIITIISKSKH